MKNTTTTHPIKHIPVTFVEDQPVRVLVVRKSL